MYNIPVEDITRQYSRIKEEVEPAILACLPECKYTLGPNVSAFEKEFADYCQAKYCVGIANGTEALHLALAACGVGPGDEVITVPNTYIATVFAISYVGADPVFADVVPDTFNLDPEQVRKAITPKTKALLPVHLYGHAVDMDPLLEIAKEFGLYVIEDDAHAHGALYKRRRCGSIGHVGCFSFYPRKVMGCFGDGGAVTTNDPELYEKIRMLRYMGQRVKYVHEVIGFQQRLDEIQAVVLRVKLRHLETWIEERRAIARQYDQLLWGTPLVLPREVGDVRHVYYTYTVLAPRRDELMAYLAERGIGSMAMYPLEVPYQPAYQYMGHKLGDFPVADTQVDQILCLPMFPELRPDEVEIVAQTVREFYGS